MGRPYRDFTRLLDLNNKTHQKCVANLRLACKGLGEWEYLKERPQLQDEIVEGFLQKYGKKYWGPDNRGLYLLPEKQNPEEVIRYPEMMVE